jgi:hypothetical protein
MPLHRIRCAGHRARPSARLSASSLPGERRGHLLRWLALVLGGCLPLLSGRPVQAARLLHAHVRRDGRVIWEGSFVDRGREDAATVWGYLDRVRLGPVGGVTVDPHNPRCATLSGDIRIVIHHGTLHGEAAVEELRLVRRSVASDRWEFAPGEVGRTARAAGLRPARPDRSIPAVVGVAGAGALATTLIWLFRRRRGRCVLGPDD